MVILKDAKLGLEHISKVKAYIEPLFDRLDKTLYYHYTDHTNNTLYSSIEICNEEKAIQCNVWSLQDTLMIAIGALFHDTGYAMQYINNEVFGAEFAKSFMEKNSLPFTQYQVDTIYDAILTTNLNELPRTIHGKILRDADLSYFGNTEDFFMQENNLRKEASQHTESPLHLASQDAKLWGTTSLNFMLNHEWFTDGAKSLYEVNKQKNILSLKDKYQLD